MMREKQFVVKELEILNGEYWWAVVNTKRVEDCFECRNKEVALRLCAFLNKAVDDFKWQIRQCEKWSAKCKQLKEENEQLKKEYKIAINEMVTDYKKLEKENEQLREKNKQIGYLKRDLFILINLIRDTPMEFNCDFEKIVERWE